MQTQVVRMAQEDVELVERLSGLPEGMPFAWKIREVLARFRRGDVDPETVRLVVREELQRLVGGWN